MWDSEGFANAHPRTDSFVVPASFIIKCYY